MTRKIKASEVREGMEIEWTSLGWYHRGVVSTVVRNDYAGVWVQSSDGIELSVEPDQVFTVLSEPQPSEPTAFASAERREPRKWDRWEDVPDRVTVRPTDAETPYRKVGDRIECKTVQEWKPSVIGEYDLNRYSPFTEVPGA